MLLVLLGNAVGCKLAKSCIAAEGILNMTLLFGMEGVKCCVEVSVKDCFNLFGCNHSDLITVLQLVLTQS